MSLPRPQVPGRRPEDESRPRRARGPRPARPLAGLACVITVIALVAAGRAWLVHRPMALSDMADARQWQADHPAWLLGVARTIDPDEQIDADLLARAASDAERVPISQSFWDARVAPLLRHLDEREAQPDRYVAELPGTQKETAERLGPDLVAVARANPSYLGFLAVAGDRVLTRATLIEAVRSQRAIDRGGEAMRRIGFRMLGLLLTIVIAWYALRRERRRDGTLRSPADIASAANVVLLVAGAIFIATRLLVQPVVPGIITWGLLEIVLLHAAAGLFVPWNNVRDAVIPAVPLLVAWIIAFMLPGGTESLGLIDRLVVAMLSSLALVPGALLTNWRLVARADRRRTEELDRRISFVDDELSRARIVHDAMFPDAFEGAVRFEYHYEPIHEIGGDYVHVHCCPNTGRVTMTLLDVAGHGLAAALTVNRLFGELERILAEDDDASPQIIMELLNRYIYLTMSRHSLFATGTCMSLDPERGELRWVGAGHPPSMLRRPNGEVSELETTSMLLGALPPDAFESIECRQSIDPGDVIIAYTDGAFEARDSGGRQFGIESLRTLAAFDPPPRSWSRFIAGAVQAHHAGVAEDDVLIATMTLSHRRIGVGRSASGQAAADRARAASEDQPSPAGATRG
ncbi:MAG: PP2C family protein-serine/threonine phosphatase [Phycisphaerales bacterium]